MNQLNLIMYSVQQYTNTIFVQQVNQLTPISCITAFFGGTITSISPCVVSCIPIASMYINNNENKTNNTLCLLSGIGTSLSFIGISTIWLKKSYWYFFNAVPFIWPIIVIGLGLSLLKIINLNLLITSPNFNRKLSFNINSFIKTYILGCSLGLTISPCSTPLIITLISWINATENYIQGICLLFIYILGYIAPITICIISIDSIKQINQLGSTSDKLIPWIGSITLATGTFSLVKEILKTIYI
uniref:Thiol:disulfi de interchange protein n=1 Tax=Liagoropsis maxima TaxID=1653392 RepID=A0A1G4NVE2_9FLOR|nr:Thiol:disulfi de interchange protein [Liagoropsis maxima]SCW22683.1 Thiol:disulfi de interchange protein [Liagoropsis maxima]